MEKKIDIQTHPPHADAPPNARLKKKLNTRTLRGIKPSHLPLRNTLAKHCYKIHLNASCLTLFVPIPSGYINPLDLLNLVLSIRIILITCSSTVVPTHKLYFLSCTPFVLNATFSTGLVVPTISWLQDLLKMSR